ncbi:MAG: glycosyltransferase family 87 protein [Candidatus Hydrogenedentes bacterium]|jgi:hypothetical protein|nr:glycosyltransferase family 87 protein [Candidatus Hydrogenedentota bacterium]
MPTAKLSDPKLPRPIPDSTAWSVWIGCGLVLFAATLGLRALSPRFVYGSDHLDRPILLMAALLSGSGLAYCLAIWTVQRSQGMWRLTLWILAVGIAMRVAMFTSTPILEDDHYRYLWDGGVAASGHNPYAYIPDEARRVVEAPHIPDAVRELSADAGHVYTRVNHPQYGTVYPPVAQAAFAVAHWLRPWSLQAWRVVLILFDIATLSLIAMLIRRLDRPTHYAAIYWWNPLVVKETVNTAHMDAIALPFVLLALYFALRSAPVRSGMAFALGIASKLWPIAIVPVVLRYMKASPWRLAVAVGVSAALLSVLLSPILVAVRLGDDSGFLAYGRGWEMNDALFMVFLKVSEVGSGLLGGDPSGPTVELTARTLVATALVLWILYLCRRPIEEPQDLCNRIVLVMSALFLLSPTQFPWYYLWLIPFLTLSPRASMLSLTVTLPMYYLRFHFEYRDNTEIFDNGVVWLEFAPAFILLLWEGRRALPRRAV